MDPMGPSKGFAVVDFDDCHKGSLPMKKTVKKADNVHTGGGLPQFIHFSLILPGPQITWKWTMHTDKLTTKCHICLHTWKQGGLMCGIWDWQSTIVKDLNDSQDPKHTLFCRENAFVTIYALFQTTYVPPFYPFRGRGGAERGQCHICLLFLYRGFPKWSFDNKLTASTILLTFSL